MIKDFYIKDLFDVINNPQLDKGNFIFSESAEYPYFTRTENNNGILGYVEYLDEEHKIPGNSLAVGMISMKFHYMQHDFYAGQFTKTLIPKFRGFNEKIALYFMTILNKHSAYYQSYLVRCFKDKVNETVVSLPVIESADPDHEYELDDIDWQSIESRITRVERGCIAELEQERIAELDAYLTASGLDDYELTDDDESVLDETPMMVGFTASTLFDIKKGKRLTKANMVVGETPFVGSSSINNGITAYIGNTEHLHPGNTFTVSYNGSVGQVFLQDEVFWASDDVNVWYPKFKFSRESIQYIMAVVKKLGVRHNYTAKWTIDKMREEKLFLPVVESSNLDHVYTSHDIHWDYMERYIRAIEKLAIADVAKRKDRLIAATKQVVEMQE